MKKIIGALLCGLVAEALMFGISASLFALSYRREPMDDPFSWTAIMIQQPGVAISERFSGAQGGVGFLLIGLAQSALWAGVALFVFSWRARKKNGKLGTDT